MPVRDEIEHDVAVLCTHCGAHQPLVGLVGNLGDHTGPEQQTIPPRLRLRAHRNGEGIQHFNVLLKGSAVDWSWLPGPV